MATNRKLYVIRHESDDWTPIVAVISGPKSPALSTLRTRFHDEFVVPAFNSITPNQAIRLGYFKLHDEAMKRIRDRGYVGVCEAELFVDWLLKTDERFERVDFREVSL